VNSERPTAAGIYNAALGGMDNFAADRAVVAAIRAVLPEFPAAAWANRAFHQRAAIWMARRGITQFIDIGCGLPARETTHEAARRILPAARVAYIDHDPAVVSVIKALIPADGGTSVTLADLRDPAGLLTILHLDELIEFAEPAGLLVTAVLQFTGQDSDPGQCLAPLVAALAPGSYVAISHMTGDHLPSGVAAACTDAFRNAADQLCLRTRAEVETYFAGLDIVPPYQGADALIAGAGLWGADDATMADDDSSRLWWAGVGHKSQLHPRAAPASIPAATGGG
jgi:hypothetical protein